MYSVLVSVALQAVILKYVLIYEKKNCECAIIMTSQIHQVLCTNSYCNVICKSPFQQGTLV